MREFFKQGGLWRNRMEWLAKAVGGTWSAYSIARPMRGGQYLILYLNGEAKANHVKSVPLRKLPPKDEISHWCMLNISQL